MAADVCKRERLKVIGRCNLVELIQDAKGLEQALALTRQLAQALNRQLGRLFWASEAV